MTPKTAGEALSDLLADQISEERGVKSSLAQRSSVAIAAAGTIVPLSLGTITLVARTQTFAVPKFALACAAIAIIFLVTAAILALIVNSPWSQTIVNLGESIQEVSTSSWGEPDPELAVAIYKYQVELASDLRKGNRRRSQYLTIVLGLEISALVAVSASVGLILLAGGL